MLQEETESAEEVDPRFLFAMPIGAGNLLNVNTTASLLELLGTAALLTALGFLIYYVVWSKVAYYKSSYGGDSYGSSGYASGSGSSYGSGYGYAR